MSQGEENSLLCETKRTSYTFVDKLKSTYDTLRFRLTVCKLEVAVLQTRPSVTVSGTRQLDYDAVVHERDRFVSFPCSLANHTGRSEDGFADFCH